MQSFTTGNKDEDMNDTIQNYATYFVSEFHHFLRFYGFVK